MKLYSENGYINMAGIIEDGNVISLVCGGRGTGKTFSTLKYVRENNVLFMYLRRTQGQADLISRPDFSPFNSIDRECGTYTCVESVTKYNSAFYNADLGEENKKLIGYTAGLSTFSNLRGFDASDVELLIFDEFIPEKHERPIKHEFDALMNCYETINRNRELSGRKPLKLLCLANANNLGNEIFMGLDLVKRSMNMAKTGVEQWTDEKRKIGLYIVQRSKISEMKKDTALYRITVGSKFEEMAIENSFSYEDISKIKPQNLKEYKPVVTVSDITVYKHKTEELYYVSMHKEGTCPTYGDGKVEIRRFLRQYPWIWARYMQNKVLFEDYLCEIKLTNVYG